MATTLLVVYMKTLLGQVTQDRDMDMDTLQLVNNRENIYKVFIGRNDISCEHYTV